MNTIMSLKKVTLLGIVILSFSKIYAQDEIESDDELNGGQIEHVAEIDKYEKEFFITLPTINLNINELLGISELVLGKTYEIGFEIPNSSNKDVVIRGFSNPCLCVQPDWQKIPIAAGATGFVKVKYTATIVGPNQKQFKAYLYDNTTFKPFAKVNIILSANIAQPNPSNQN